MQRRALIFMPIFSRLAIRANIKMSLYMSQNELIMYGPSKKKCLIETGYKQTIASIRQLL